MTAGSNPVLTTKKIKVMEMNWKKMGFKSKEDYEKFLDMKMKDLFNNLLNAAEEGYILVKWPKCQGFMEEDWFNDEAILALGSEDKTGSGAYFIPIKRIV